MKNTGNTYTSAERSPVILPEMAELLPPLSEEQLSALEADLIQNGCYAPVIVNEDMVIIDGHNRQALCEKHGLLYTMTVFSFENLLEAKQWALDTQKGRRNLEKWELGKIALKLKPEIEAKARANMAAGGQNFRPSKAYEKAALLTATEENVRCWTEGTRMTLEELRDTARESREIAQVFNMVADIIEQKILPSDWRNADHADDAPGEVAS